VVGDKVEKRGKVTGSREEGRNEGKRDSTVSLSLWKRKFRKLTKEEMKKRKEISLAEGRTESEDPAY